MANPDTVKKKMIKRLSNWDNFFERIQGAKCADDEDEMCFDPLDPAFLAVNDEHSKLRETLCTEIGISQEELQTPLSSSSDEQNSSNNEATSEDENNEKVEEKDPPRRSCTQTSSRAVSPLRTDLLNPKRTTDTPMTSPHGLCENNTPHTKERSMEDVQTPNWTTARFCHTSTPVQKDISRKLPQFQSNIDRERAVTKLREQYVQWKLYKRRKSGKFGRLYIVSDLNEKLTEANLYIPPVPPPVENPFPPIRRFSLKKINY